MKNSKFERFTGIYCSGFFIPNPSMLTTLCLLFDNFYLANNLEYLLEFVKRYKFTINDSSILEKINHMTIKPYEDSCPDPFANLSKKQLETAKVYLFQARNFFMHNHELIGKVIKSSMCPEDEVFNVELVRKGNPGKLNEYRVSEKPLIVSLDGLQQFNDLIESGAIPIIGKCNIHKSINMGENIPSRYLAALLAMKSIELVLPAMKEANPETILEARDKLQDQLPLFWSSMLKLSTELRSRIEDDMKEKDIIFETQEIVDTTVRPAIIELKRKLEMERKNWFYKILHPMYDGVKMFIGNPRLTTGNLAITGLTTGLNIANNFVCHTEEIDKIKKEAGLTFLLRLDELVMQ